MFVVSQSTVLNPQALETVTVPKRMLGRIAILPRRGAGLRIIARLVFEAQMLRYLCALAPFVIAMFIWPHLALPISQAPVPMLIVIAVVETKVFAIRPDAREALISDADMARQLDALRFNSLHILTRIAAARQITTGELHLVVEQSEIARVSPLTLVSAQMGGQKPRVLTLDPTERALITDALFDDTLTERDLLRVSLREDKNLHDTVLDASTVPAHARMAALMDQYSASPALQEA
ncbi:hypothetical protein [uncultured Roseobacter sp.]|uniref:hypothetical protein n=1 Tax=uncultured Roseobacter sp. TaxID=114847 RepID=UPI0026343A40|nr:hypothetical protein [uncultured Roseobacter sp.]